MHSGMWSVSLEAPQVLTVSNETEQLAIDGLVDYVMGNFPVMVWIANRLCTRRSLQGEPPPVQKLHKMDVWCLDRFWCIR